MSKEDESHAASDRLDERVFAPLSPQDLPSAVRRRGTLSSCRGDGTHGRRAWNSSTQDDQHPFPQPALLHTTACYNGVEVVPTYFPETVQGSGFLRVPESAKPGVWMRNRTRAAASSRRYTYRCDELAGRETALSYLAKTIVEDADPEKKALRDGWCASTTLEGSRGNRFIVPATEDVSYQSAHHELTERLATTAAGGYVSPYLRVKQLNATLAEQRTQQQRAETESLEALYFARHGPAAFKLSNADQWWDMDPVAVTREIMEQVEKMKANPYSTTFRSTASLSSKSASSSM
ncbi:hypothetical protein N2W54_003420 [Lotmaria passim]